MNSAENLINRITSQLVPTGSVVSILTFYLLAHGYTSVTKSKWNDELATTDLSLNILSSNFIRHQTEEHEANFSPYEFQADGWLSPDDGWGNEVLTQNMLLMTLRQQTRQRQITWRW